MKRNTKSLLQIHDRLRLLESNGALEPGQTEAFASARKRFFHAGEIGDVDGLLRAANDLSKIFLRIDE